MGLQKSLKIIMPILVLLAAVVLLAASCGSETSDSQDSTSTTKLPPGADSETTSDGSSTTVQTEQQTTTTAQANSTTKTVSLDGVNFTVSKAAREDSNEVVLSSNSRELLGDFLEIELAVENASGELVEISDYSFRLYNAALVASSYDDYYGDTGTYGKYVSSHVISASLLDYSSLSTVSYTLRKGEKLEDVFLFFDLNPQSTTKNESISKDATNLIIYDSETGDKVDVNLAGFTD